MCQKVRHNNKIIINLSEFFGERERISSGFLRASEYVQNNFNQIQNISNQVQNILEYVNLVLEYLQSGSIYFKYHFK